MKRGAWDGGEVRETAAAHCFSLIRNRWVCRTFEASSTTEVVRCCRILNSALLVVHGRLHDSQNLRVLTQKHYTEHDLIAWAHVLKCIIKCIADRNIESDIAFDIIYGLFPEKNEKTVESSSFY